MTKLVRIFFASLFLIGPISSGSVAGHAATTTTTVTNVGFNLDSDVVPSNLRWTKKSIAIAKKVQGILYRTILDELNYLRAAGAVRVVRVKHPTESGVRNWNKLDVDKNLYSLAGYDSDGALVGNTETFFADFQGVESRTVYLAQEECLFRPFSFFDIATWFTHQCSITVESKDKFLRSAMQSWLSLTGGFTPDGISIGEELKTISSQGLRFRVQDQIFSCLNCSVFFQTPYTSFPMEYSGGLWPYKITYDEASSQLAMTIRKPNYRDLMDNIYLGPQDTVLFAPPESKVSKFTLLK